MGGIVWLKIQLRLLENKFSKAPDEQRLLNPGNLQKSVCCLLCTVTLEYVCRQMLTYLYANTYIHYTLRNTHEQHKTPMSMHSPTPTLSTCYTHQPIYWSLIHTGPTRVLQAGSHAGTAQLHNA